MPGMLPPTTRFSKLLALAPHFFHIPSTETIILIGELKMTAPNIENMDAVIENCKPGIWLSRSRAHPDNDELREFSVRWVEEGEIDIGMNFEKWKEVVGALEEKFKGDIEKIGEGPVIFPEGTKWKRIGVIVDGPIVTMAAKAYLTENAAELIMRGNNASEEASADEEVDMEYFYEAIELTGTEDCYDQENIFHTLGGMAWNDDIGGGQVWTAKNTTGQIVAIRVFSPRGRDDEADPEDIEMLGDIPYDA